MGQVARRVYVISDLHIGGAYPVPGSGDTRGFRLNTHVDVATQFVTRLTASATAGVSLELVINGDIVDFLAERSSSGPVWVPFTPDPDDACQKLEAIVTRDQPFFDALARFLAAGHRLTLLLGNHDIELDLPPVRAKFASLLGIGGHTDYEFIANDEAYVIGGALIEHGNRYDGFNMVDYDSLRRVSALMSRRQEARQSLHVRRAAGQQDGRVGDQSDQGAVSIHRSADARERRGGAAAARARAGRARPARQGCGAWVGGRPRREDAAAAALGRAAPAPAGGQVLQSLVHTSLGARAFGYLRALEHDLASIDAKVATADATARVDFDRDRGLACLLTAHKDGDVQARLPALLEAVRALQGDKTFDRSVETGTEYLNSARALARQGGFQIVTYGHTHLAKKVPLDNGAVYFNSGAWVDFMQFPPEIISGPSDVAQQQLQSFVDAVGTGGLTPFVMFQPTYLRFDLDGAGQLVNADLYDYSETGSL